MPKGTDAMTGAAVGTEAARASESGDDECKLTGWDTVEPLDTRELKMLRAAKKYGWKISSEAARRVRRFV